MYGPPCIGGPSPVLLYQCGSLTACLCRTSQVRLACSPDEQSYLTIREPAPCSYVLVLLTPHMCRHSDYEPAWILQLPQQAQQVSE